MRQDRFAAELGMSRESISAYERDLRPIPPVVALACEVLRPRVRLAMVASGDGPHGDGSTRPDDDHGTSVKDIIV